jgi:hypothetical protein
MPHYYYMPRQQNAGDARRRKKRERRDFLTAWAWAIFYTIGGIVIAICIASAIAGLLQ